MHGTSNCLSLSESHRSRYARSPGSEQFENLLAIPLENSQPTMDRPQTTNPLKMGVEEDDDDNISITSTQESDYDPDKEFIVTRILAEKESGKNKRQYLILWEDYPIEKATWEPKAHIGPEILDQWALRQKEEKRGLKEPFDLKEWQAKLDQATREKERRKKLRREKRKRLGIPVPMSESDIDDSSSDEAIEENEFDDSPAAKVSGGKSATPVKPSKKPDRFMVRGTRAERLDDHSSDSDNNSSRPPKPPRRVSSQSIAPSLKVQKVVPKPVQTSGDPGTASDSSSEVPLAQKRRKLTGQESAALRNLEQPSSKAGVMAPRKLDGMSTEVEQQDLGGLPQPEKSRAPPSINLPMSPKTSSLFIGATSPAEVEKRPLGRPSTRGKLAARGGTTVGSSALRKNVFESSGTPTKARGRKPGHNLLKIAMDTSKDPKVTNRHLMRKLELQARDVAEAAPDISAIGGLFNPSNMESVEAVRPSTLRKPSSSIVIGHDPTIHTNNYNLRKETDNNPVAPVPPSSTATKQGSGKQICFFWNRAEQNKKTQDCANGYLCYYLHQYEFGATVAPPPAGFVEGPENPGSNNKGPRNYDDYYTAVCYYWHRAQQDASHQSCNRGPNCKFLHSYKAGVPIAPAPTVISAVGPGNADLDHNISTESPKHSGSLSAKTVSETTMPPWRDQSAPDPTTVSTNMPQSSTEASVAQNHQERPPWNPLKGNTAICHFWWTHSYCKKGDDCKLYHSNDMRLPVAPHRDEQLRIMGRITCPRWIQGDCDFGRECSFAHEHQPVALEVQEDYSTFAMDPSPRKADDNISHPSTEPAKKSVKFLLDEPEKMVDELANMSPAHESHAVCQSNSRRTWQSKVPCLFYARGICNKGFNCSFLHDSQFNYPEHKDLEISNTVEYQNSTGFRDTTSIQELPSASGETRELAGTVNTNDLTLQTNDAADNKDGAAKLPRKKVNLAQYNQQKARQKVSARSKPVYFGQSELNPVILDFGDIENAPKSQWRREFPNVDRVTFSHMCLAQDFQVQQGYLQRRVVFRGTLVAADVDNKEVTKVLEKIVDELIVRSAGLLASFPTYSILIFPALKDEWKYLEASYDHLKEGRLRYFVFETDWDVNQLQNDEVASMGFVKPYRKPLVDMIHGLDIKKLMPHVGTSQDPHKYFLLFPPSASHTSSFLATWLKEQNSQAKIYDSQKPGTWDYFRKTFDTGVLLVHETAATNLHLLSGLFEILFKRNYSFWCISSGDTMYPLYPSRYYGVDPSSLGRISATRLFPQGCAMLLTPSFLVADPKRAYDLVKTFLDKNKSAAPGTWKLVCAGNICNYLLNLAISKVKEKDALERENRDNPAKDAILSDAGLSFTHCDFRNKLHALFVHQEARGLLDSPIESDGFETEHAFHREKDVHIIQADMFIDPDDEPALIKWFWEWTMRNLDNHRKFVVIGTGPLSAPRAHRMKEFADVPELAHTPDSETVPDGKAIVEALTTSESTYQPSSTDKQDTFQSTSLEKSTAEANRTAMEVAARLKALHPEHSSMAATSELAREDLVNEKVLLSTDKQAGESTKHGINYSMPTTQLQFCSVTGGTAEDAITFLAKSNNDLKLAIELYNHADAMNLDAQVSQLFASVASKTSSPAPLRILTAEKDLARARELVDATSSSVSANSASNAITSARLAQYDGSYDTYSPQYDGADDRPMSSGSGSTTHSGIATSENGQRFVPRSVRHDNSIRKEINVRPGFVPREDIDRYVSPIVVASRDPSRTNRMRSFPTPLVVPDSTPVESLLDPYRTDIDEENTRSAVEQQNGPTTNPSAFRAGSRTNTGPMETAPKKPNVQLRKHIFKDTVSWYEEYKKTNGSGWEHMFIGTYEDAVKKSGLGPPK